MRMSAYDHIYALLHKEGCPLLLIFVRHGLVFCAPVCNKNKTVTDGFGFLDHSGDLVLVKDVDHVFVAFACTRVVGAICIIKKSNLNPVYFFDLDDIRVLLGGVDTQHRNCGIFGTPEIQSGFQIIVSIIICMVGGRFHYIEASLDDGISNLLGSCKGGIGTDRIMIRGKNGLLVDHGHICSLDLIQNIGINMVIIPGAGIVLTGFVQLTVIEIVSNCDHTCSGDLRGFRSFFCLFFLLLCLLGGFFLRLGDQAVVQLMHQENQHDQNCRGT